MTQIPLPMHRKRRNRYVVHCLHLATCLIEQNHMSGDTLSIVLQTHQVSARLNQPLLRYFYFHHSKTYELRYFSLEKKSVGQEPVGLMACALDMLFTLPNDTGYQKCRYGCKCTIDTLVVCTRDVHLKHDLILNQLLVFCDVPNLWGENFSTHILYRAYLGVMSISSSRPLDPLSMSQIHMLYFIFICCAPYSCQRNLSERNLVLVTSIIHVYVPSEHTLSTSTTL